MKLKKVLAIMLAMMMVLTSLSVVSFAAAEFPKVEQMIADYNANYTAFKEAYDAMCAVSGIDADLFYDYAVDCRAELRDVYYNSSESYTQTTFRNDFRTIMLQEMY
ncbi:MAG: hypothetical protein IJQ50_01515, partial [Clostridia bacterium]|nr:hypothetical protein [Clostridia bacterium]